jgi:hypothetical protein
LQVIVVPRGALMFLALMTGRLSVLIVLSCVVPVDAPFAARRSRSSSRCEPISIGVRLKEAI